MLLILSSSVVDGAFGLSLEERAKLASQARHALKLYARERSQLPVRLFARFYDGFRHWLDFGSWAADGLTWPELKLKYTRQARRELGEHATNEQIEEFVYRKIVDKACCTNKFLDSLAERSLYDVSTTSSSCSTTDSDGVIDSPNREKEDSSTPLSSSLNLLDTLISKWKFFSM